MPKHCSLAGVALLLWLTGFISSGCRTNSARLNYADEVVPPGKALPHCAFKQLDEEAPGLRPFSNYNISQDTLERAREVLNEQGSLKEVYEFGLKKKQLLELASETKVPLEELGILFTYTREGDVLYNNALRKGGEAYLKWKELILTVVSALNKLAPTKTVKGEVFRFETVTKESASRIKELAKEGAVFGEYAFTSASPKEYRLLEWSQLALKKNPDRPSLVVYKIQSKTGVDISSASYYQGEGEVLFLPSSTFKVKGKKTKKYENKEYLEIEMEEIFEDAGSFLPMPL